MNSSIHCKTASSAMSSATTSNGSVIPLLLCMQNPIQSCINSCQLLMIPFSKGYRQNPTWNSDIMYIPKVETIYRPYKPKAYYLQIWKSIVSQLPILQNICLKV